MTTAPPEENSHPFSPSDCCSPWLCCAWLPVTPASAQPHGIWVCFQCGFIFLFYFLLLLLFSDSSASSNFCTGRGGGSLVGSARSRAGCSLRRQRAPCSPLRVTQVRAFERAASRTSQQFSPHFYESLFYAPAPITMTVGRGNPCLCTLDKQEQVKCPRKGGLCPCRYLCIQELCPQCALDQLPACAGGGCSPLGFHGGTGLPTQLLCLAGHGTAGGVCWARSYWSRTGVCTRLGVGCWGSCSWVEEPIAAPVFTPQTPGPAQV